MRRRRNPTITPADIQRDDRRGYLTRPEVDEYTKLRRKLLAAAKEHYTKDSYDKIRALL
jgi:hypothetical protein